MRTIQDVARHAGVSVSTVSNVLNGRADRMGRETLARVEAAIAALAFRPNRAARQLKTGRASMLGLLVPSIANPMYGAVAREIETVAAERHGLRVVLGNTYRDAAKEAGFFQDLLEHGVRGVVVISSLEDERHLERAVAQGLVVVSYDRRAAPGMPSLVDHVSVDNAQAARLAAQCLIAHGHQRLAFVTVAGQTMSRSEKIRGFREACAEAALGGEALVVDGHPRSGYGDTEMAELGRAEAHRLAALRQRPSGVIAVNDLLAYGLMAGFRDAGLAVPRDVSVVGIDGLFLSSLVTPALTTVALPLPEMAATIVERLVGRLADPSVATGEFLFRPALVERDSVGPPRLRARQAAQHRGAAAS